MHVSYLKANTTDLKKQNKKKKKNAWELVHEPSPLYLTKSKVSGNLGAKMLEIVEKEMAKP